MADSVYEVIIIGAGVEGSSTGYYLTSRCTSNVLLLEQFDCGHTRGSSHGGSRITRRAYREPFYVKMMDEAFKLWAEVEEKSNTVLYKKCGILVFGYEHVQRYIDAIRASNVPHQVMSGREANERYPQQLKLPDDYLCVFEEDGGILRASKAVAALQDLFVRQGGHFRDNHKVTGLIPGPIVTVQTDKGDFRAKRVIITAGAWTNKLLQATGLTLPLEVVRNEVLYWRTEEPETFSPDNFPTFGFTNNEDTIVYGIPVYEYPGLVKICHYHSLVIPDPDDRDASPHSYTTDTVAQFICQHFRGVKATPAIFEFCLYTNTPTKDPFLDTHPRYPNIVIGAGFSGHGFKLGPVVGKILSQLALGQPTAYDLAPFRIDKSGAKL